MCIYNCLFLSLGFIDVYILVILFLHFFLRFFLCGANQLYVQLSLSHDFEQFGSLHTCAPRKDTGRSGIRTLYPGLRVNHATNELSWRHNTSKFLVLESYLSKISYLWGLHGNKVHFGVPYCCISYLACNDLICGLWVPQQTLDVYTMLGHCWASVADGRPKLPQHYMKVSCLLVWD